MEILSAWYRQDEKNGSEMLLKHYSYMGRAVYFACVCTHDHLQQFMVGMEEFFCRIQAKKFILHSEQYWARLKGELEEYLEDYSERCLKEDSDQDKPPGFAGVIGADNECLLFGKGDASVNLINLRMGETNVLDLRQETGNYAQEALPFGKEIVHSATDSTFFVVQAELEPEIGVLIATKEFQESVPMDAVKSGLKVGYLDTKERIQKHLEELGRAVSEEDRENLAAILLVSKED